MLLFIAIYTYRFAGKTGWHSKGLWLGAAVCVGLVFLDAYLEAVRESGQYSRFESCVTKIWACFAVVFFSIAALAFAGITVWLLVIALQSIPRSIPAAMLMFMLSFAPALFVIVMLKHLQRNLTY
mgnify:CR=1 FL=1